MSQQDRPANKEEETTLREQAPPSTVRDMGITALFMLLAVGFFAVSQQFAGNRISEYDPGASFWPRATLIVILVSGLFNFVILYRRAKKNGETISLGGFDSSDIDLSENQRQYLLAIGISVVFFVSLEHVGFLVASPLFMFVFAYTIGYRDLGKLAVFSVAVAIIVFFAFRNVMNIALPYGNGIFREISVYASNLF